LRHQNPALRRGEFIRLWSADGTYAFSRSLDGKTVVVALNTSETTQPANVKFEATGNPRVLFGRPADISVGDGHLRFTVPPRSGVVLG
jgi:hypothetical protein